MYKKEPKPINLDNPDCYVPNFRDYPKNIKKEPKQAYFDAFDIPKLFIKPSDKP
jgi:hypothetical protein